MKPFISLCMIVKNEEKVLKRCLESVDGLVDEIIIVDTGSIDNTKKIASEFNTNIYDYQWNNNFSDARNFAQSKANGEWILFLDADEYVEHQNLMETINKLKEIGSVQSFDAYIVTQINFGGNFGESVNPCLTARIYKNDPSIGFYRSIHEQLHKKDGEISFGFLNLYIYHSGYLNSTQKGKKKTNRNVTLIQSELKNNENAFDYFNMGNEYGVQGKYEEALESYKKAYLQKKDNNQIWVPHAVERIVYCLIKLNRIDEAIKVSEDASINWPNIADFKCLNGHLYYIQKRFDDAISVFLDLVANKNKYTTCQSINYLEYFPYKYLGELFEEQNELEKAVKYYSNTLNFFEKDIYIMEKLYKLLLKYESKKNVVSFIQHQKSLNNIVNRYLLIKVLLDIGEVELSEYFIKEWNLDYSKGILFKIYLLKNECDRAYQLIEKMNIEEFLKEGWSDLADLLICGIKLKDNIFNNILIENLSDKYEIINFLLNKSQLRDLNVVKIQLLSLLQKCIQYREFEVFEQIVDDINTLSINTELGNLLYKNDFKELAIDFYQKTDFNELDEQAFINIIEMFLEQKNIEEALSYVYLALNNDKLDFRIFKLAIEILNEMEIFDDKEKMIEISLNYFPNSKYLLSLKANNNLAEDISEYELQERINEISIQAETIQGWIMPQAGEMLYKIARFQSPTPTIVELGSWKGKSTVWLANAIKDRGEGIVIAIDHWKGSNESTHEKMLEDYTEGQLYNEFMENMSRLKIKNYIKTIKMDTLSAVKEVLKMDLEIGLLFIDASHEYIDVRKDFEFWSPMVKIGGYIVFDDVPSWPGPTKLVSELPRWYKQVAVSPNHWIVQKVE